MEKQLSVYDEVDHEIHIKGSITKALIGFETSGVIHLGHYLILCKLQEYMSKGISGTILLADLHARLNKKENIDYYLDKSLKFFNLLLPNCKIVTSSQLVKEEEYWLQVLEFAQFFKVRNGFRALPMGTKLKEDKELHSLPLSILLYPLLQCIDSHFLNADLILCGKDQRNIYMEIYNHYHKLNWVKPSIHFLPLLTLQGSISTFKEKMSSSKKCIPVDGSLYLKVLNYEKGQPSPEIETLLASKIYQTFGFPDSKSFLKKLKSDTLLLKNFFW